MHDATISERVFVTTRGSVLAGHGEESLWATCPSAAEMHELPLDVDVNVDSLRVMAALNAEDGAARSFSTAVDADTLRQTIVD